MESERIDKNDIEHTAMAAASVAEVALLLRQLRRRDARDRQAAERTHKELAALVGCSAASIGFYLSGAVLPPAARLDELARCLGATPQERRALVAARDRAVEPGSPQPPKGQAPAQVPRTLPPGPTAFVGRAAALAKLDAATGARSDRRSGDAAAVISGMGGVGKTALALHWAHRSAHLFPDGQLYVNLRAYGPQEPVTVAAALQTLLVSLGVPATALPSDVDDRAALYRELLSGRRLLVLLDNAAGAAQLLPLLPPPPGFALVTSRDSLPDLVTEHGAHSVPLDVLSEVEATELLRSLVGARCDREPQAVQALLRRCGRLPLALRVVAEIATARPTVTLAEMMAEREADYPGLDTFATGDASSDVREVLSWSLRSLPGPVARAFRLLGLAPTELVDAYGMAALAGVDPAQAQELLDALAQAHLLAPAGPGRYAIHDLLRLYASEIAERDLHPDGRRAAVHRQLDYYLAVASTATGIRFPYRLGVQPRRPPRPLDEVHAPDLSTVEQASSWLNTERPALVRLAVGAAASGQPGHAVALALALAPLLDGEFNDDGLAVFGAAYAAVGEDGDPIDRAHLERCLGYVHLGLGRLHEAALYFDRAIATFSADGEISEAVPSIAGLGVLRAVEGRFEEARSYLRQGVRLAQEAGQPVQESALWGNLGAVCADLEEWDSAEECARNALAVAAEHGHAVRPHIHVCRARAAEGRGQYDEATEHALTGLDLASAYDDVIGELHTLEVLASIDRRLGRYDEGTRSLESALQAHRRHCRPGTLAHVLNTLGEIYLDAGSPSLARDRHAEARRYAELAGFRLQVARALVHLGDAQAALDEPATARSLWREALNLYEAMHHPAAARTAQRLGQFR